MFNSMTDTLQHIANVERLINLVAETLRLRGAVHDASKLSDPEKEIFDRFTPILRGLTYGSNEYRQTLNEMAPALQHHYEINRHHPEHHKRGINGMTLIDIVEMLCDWKAATMRHDDGDVVRSLSINANRFGIGPQLEEILCNTIFSLGWVDGNKERSAHDDGTRESVPA